MCEKCNAELWLLDFTIRIALSYQQQSLLCYIKAFLWNLNLNWALAASLKSSQPDGKRLIHWVFRKCFDVGMG